MIRTDRLELKPLYEKDAAALFSYRALLEVYRFQSWQPKDEQQALEFIQKYSAGNEIKYDQWHQYGIFLKNTDQLIGDCGFCICSKNSAEIGYSIAPAFQKQGYATETVLALVEFLFGREDVSTVIARTDPRNKPSVRVLQKCGFNLQMELRKSVLIRGEWQDDWVFEKHKSV